MEKKKFLIVALTGLILAYLYNQLKSSGKSPIVQTSYGKVVGSIDFSRTGKEFYQYLGIPYALPPIGEKRFEAPEPMTPWEGVKECTSHGPICIQLKMVTFQQVGSEDCLFLNVFAPKEKKSNALPVMVFIHGGIFYAGGSDTYGAHYFMDEEIILATFNYRLNALGFLNTGDGVVRGNMGLKDQLMAMTWIKTNIEAFGGDPNRITLVGESAGAVSAAYHIMSPRSKGLFSKIILQSGTALHYWALFPDPKKQAQRFAAKVGCPTLDSKQMVACLKKLDATDLVNGHRDLGVFLRDLIDSFVPTLETIVDENTFMSENPRLLLEEGRFYKVPMIAGVNSEEGISRSAVITANQTKMNEANERWTWWVSQFLDVPRDEEMAKLFRKFYFGDNENIANKSLITNYTNMVSDRLVLASFHQFTKLYCVHAPMRLYYFSYKGDFSITYYTAASEGHFPHMFNYLFDKFSRWFRRTVLREDVPLFGPAHADDLVMFFQIYLRFGLNIDVKPNHKDFDVSTKMVKTWVSFATNDATEDLTYGDLKWLPLNSKDSKFTYLQIDKEPGYVVDPFKERGDFWESLAIPC